jgi:hypothetical protein
LSPRCPFLSPKTDLFFAIISLIKYLQYGTKFAKAINLMKGARTNTGRSALNHQLFSALSEKRKHPRIPLRLPTQYVLSGSAKPRICHTLNIAEGGVLLCLPEKLEIGRQVEIEIFYYFDYELASFTGTGNMVWLESVEDSPSEYRGALEFTNLPPSDYAKLKCFLGKIFS